MLLYERYRLVPRDDWISFHVVGVEHRTLVEDDLERAFKRISEARECKQRVFQPHRTAIIHWMPG